MKKEIKGLGDLIEKVTEVTGIKNIVEKTTDLLDIEDCGCQRRKDFLNNMIPFSTPKINSDVLKSQPPSEFKTGIYLVRGSFSITKSDNIYSCKAGDKIYIRNNHPAWNDFKNLYSKGILIKDDVI